MRDDINDNLEREARNWIERQEAEKAHRAMFEEDARHSRNVELLCGVVVVGVVGVVALLALYWAIRLTEEWR